MKTALTVLAAFVWSAVMVGLIVAMAFYSRPPEPVQACFMALDPAGNPVSSRLRLVGQPDTAARLE